MELTHTCGNSHQTELFHSTTVHLSLPLFLTHTHNHTHAVSLFYATFHLVRATKQTSALGQRRDARTHACMHTRAHTHTQRADKHRTLSVHVLQCIVGVGVVIDLRPGEGNVTPCGRRCDCAV